MAVSNAVVSMVRVLAIIHIVVGALLIIFGIADGVTTVLGNDFTFIAGYRFYGVWIGAWVSVSCRNSKITVVVFIFLTYKHLGCALKVSQYAMDAFLNLSTANVRETSVVKLWSNLWQVLLLKAQGFGKNLHTARWLWHNSVA